MEIENQLIKSNEIFQLDYKGQSLKNNKKFEEWQKEQLARYGSNAKLYKCIQDNGYFYSPTKNNKYFSFDAKRCPSCNKQICYFCSKISYADNEDDSRRVLSECCPTSNMYYLLFHKTKRFLYNNENYYLSVKYENTYKKFFIPLFSFIYLVGIISFCLFHGLMYKYNIPEEQYFKEDCPSITSIILNALVGLILSLIFFIHTIYFKLLLLISSVCSKKNPLNYYLGIINFGLNQFR